ncbi:hypothetical protein D3C75_547560 [compost metagenome]
MRLFRISRGAFPEKGKALLPCYQQKGYSGLMIENNENESFNNSVKSFYKTDPCWGYSIKISRIMRSHELVQFYKALIPSIL